MLQLSSFFCHSWIYVIQNTKNLQSFFCNKIRLCTLTFSHIPDSGSQFELGTLADKNTNQTILKYTWKRQDIFINYVNWWSQKAECIDIIYYQIFIVTWITSWGDCLLSYNFANYLEYLRARGGRHVWPTSLSSGNSLEWQNGHCQRPVSSSLTGLAWSNWSPCGRLWAMPDTWACTSLPAVEDKDCMAILFSTGADFMRDASPEQRYFGPTCSA